MGKETTVPGVTARLTLAFMFAVGGLFGTGCALGFGEEACTEKNSGTSVCHGNSADYCGGEETEWEREDCGAGVCLMKGGRATCVDHDTRHPRCDWNLRPSSHGRRFCDGSTAYQCDEEGYANAIESCDAPESKAPYCIETEDDGFCAESPEPDPRCAATPNWGVCDGSTLMRCILGYRATSEDCAGYCVEYEDFPGYKLCAAAPEPEPACGPDNSAGTACVDNVAITCGYGFRVSEEPCGDDICTMTADGARCVPPPDPKCIVAGTSYYCDGTALVTCDAGRSGTRSDCTPESCITQSAGVAYCGTSP